MADKILSGRKINKGKAKGEALVAYSPISFYGGVDMDTGVIVDPDNELNGQNISGKILVFPVGKGSTGGSTTLYELACSRKAPKAIICNRINPIIATGAIMGNIPSMDQVAPDPLKEIKTDDMVEIDADQGIIKVWSHI